MSSVAPSSAVPQHHGLTYEEAWSRAYETVSDEHVGRLKLIEGNIPRALRGTLFRNGPARFERGSTPYGHLFDGDGMIASFAFDDLGVVYRNRFVRTAAYDEEQRTGQVRYRGFGTPRPGGARANAFRPRFKNAANTGVVAHAGDVLALWEGGLPHRVDPVTLATIGPHDFGGALLARPSLTTALIGRELPFCAHPKHDRATGELIAFGLRMGLRSSLLIHRVDRRGVMKPTRQIPLDALWFVHDFAVTPRWLVFVLCPVAFQIAPMLLGHKTPAQALAGDDQRKLRVLAVERASLDSNKAPRVRMASAPEARGFAFHVVNAFERDEDRIAIDVAWTASFPSIPSPQTRPLPKLVPPRLGRIDVDLGREQLAITTRSRSLLEIPEIDPRAIGIDHELIWGLGGDDALSALVRLERGGRERLREFAPDVVAPPLFVPRPTSTREGDGWIVTTLYRAQTRTSELLVLDSTTLRTLARAALPHPIPPHFHGCWLKSPQ